MSAQRGQAIEIFFSYAHEDEILRKTLEKHLSTLGHQGLIIHWYDRDISAGLERSHEIMSHLNSAHIILLLVSADFIASEDRYGTEVKLAMERHLRREAHVIPILLRPSDWEGTIFGPLQALPRNRKPITSWPDPDEAFTEIAKEIRWLVEQLQKQTSAGHSSSFPLSNLPYERNYLFTGRKDVLLHLHTAFRTGQTLVFPQAIRGLGGIGKTQTALQYAYQYQDDYDFILWTKAESQETLLSDVISIAHLLQVSEQGETDHVSIMTRVKDWLQSHLRWLLILDNADDLSLIKDLLPSQPKGHILLTTRAQALSKLAQPIDITTMLPEEGALFLLKRATLLDPQDPLMNASESAQSTAKEISQVLGGLPLALDQAGAYIEETRCSLQEYLHLLQVRQADLLRHRGTLTHDHPDSVASTWSLSFENVQHVNPAAADLLRFCAFLDPDIIPEEIFIEASSELGPTLRRLGTDPMKLNEAIGELLKYSLVHRNPNRSLTIHRLIQAVLKNEMTRQTQRRWIERTIRAINSMFPHQVEYRTWNRCLEYLPQAQQCAILIEDGNIETEEAAQLLTRVSDYLSAIAQYTQAEPLYQRALAISEQKLGLDHPDTATTLDNLAGLYDDQGLYEKAEPLYQRAKKFDNYNHDPKNREQN